MAICKPWWYIKGLDSKCCGVLCALKTRSAWYHSWPTICLPLSTKHLSYIIYSELLKKTGFYCNKLRHCASIIYRLKTWFKIRRVSILLGILKIQFFYFFIFFLDAFLRSIRLSFCLSSSNLHPTINLLCGWIFSKTKDYDSSLFLS